MRKLILLILLPVLFLACQRRVFDESKTPLVKVNDKILYQENLPQDLTNNLSSADSAKIVNDYIKRWIIDAVMFDYAKRNVADMEEIDQLVEEYRQSLIVQRYQQLLIEQRLPQPTQAQIKEYYEKNSELFLAEENLIRGIMIKIPNTAKKNVNLRKWLTSGEPNDLEKMEHYCIVNGGSLDYFKDKWYYADDIFSKMPSLPMEEKSVITSGQLLELNDSVNVYLLKIFDYKLEGMPEPLDLASNRIKNILLNENKRKFIHEFEEDIYKHIEKDIVYYNEKGAEK